MIAKEGKHIARLFAYGVLERTVPTLWRELLFAVSRDPSYVEEIRLRAGAPSSYRVGGKDKFLATRVTARELDLVFEALTESSTYLYGKSISEGYVTVSGIRVGLVGRPGALFALVFRLPLSVLGCGAELWHVFQKYGSPGVLIASSPGGGKTTALRALTMHLGMAGYRVAAVDTRGEFLPSDYSTAAVDIITGYGRSEGVRMAIATLSPDVIACDEMFTESDIDSLISAHGAGVKVLATVHSGDCGALFTGDRLKRVFDFGIFGLVIKITRRADKFFYTPMEVNNACVGDCADSFCLSFH